MQSLVGLVSVVIGMGAAAYFLKMDEIGWILVQLLPSLPIALIVVFHPEIRRALAGIGGQAGSMKITAEAAVNSVVQSIDYFSRRNIGALIAFERKVSLRQYEQHGTELNAPVVAELLNSIFTPHSSLHDGGVIIREGVIAAAGCVFPLATGRDGRHAYGTRHRAAIGLSEESDALVIVISEETGAISAADHGELTRGMNLKEVRELLRKAYSLKEGGQEP